MGWEVITPELAQEYLSRNKNNYRKVNNGRVAAYAQDIKAGNWQANGESIKFDKEGNLKDGQHRLSAIIMAGIPVRMMVLRDLDNDVIIFDSGMNRTAQQIFENLVGSKSASSSLLAGVRLIVNQSKAKAMPKMKVISHLSSNYDFWKLVESICNTGGKGGINNSLGKRASCYAVVYAYLKTQKIQIWQAKEFFIAFNTGNVVGCTHDMSSALVARRQFTDFKAMNGSQAQFAQIDILKQALDDYINNKTRNNNYKINFNYAESIFDSVREIDEIK